jgi:hypothetical protein|tara:strand:- start:2 stop:331 length:330 start_codon:yes stop_codon:yes gene_type:complete
MMTKEFGLGFNSLNLYSRVSTITFTEVISKRTHCVENIVGKKASLKILCAITEKSAVLSGSEARMGLEFFGDYVADEMASPNAHPNIRLLLDTIEHDLRWTISIETSDN